jgi:hypothetical protein
MAVTGTVKCKSPRWKHQWSRNEDVVAMYLQKYGVGKFLGEEWTLFRIASTMGLSSTDTLIMRMANLKKARGLPGGLDHTTDQMYDVVAECECLSKTEFRDKVLAILNEAHRE